MHYYEVAVAMNETLFVQLTATQMNESLHFNDTANDHHNLNKSLHNSVKFLVFVGKEKYPTESDYFQYCKLPLLSVPACEDEQNVTTKDAGEVLEECSSTSMGSEQLSTKCGRLWRCFFTANESAAIG
jgi:hypothetical protein